MMNLTIQTAWVIVEAGNHHSLVDGILYPSKEAAICVLSGKYRWEVILLADHIDAVYELGLAGPSFM